MGIRRSFFDPKRRSFFLRALPLHLRYRLRDARACSWLAVAMVSALGALQAASLCAMALSGQAKSAHWPATAGCWILGGLGVSLLALTAGLSWRMLRGWLRAEPVLFGPTARSQELDEGLRALRARVVAEEEAADIRAIVDATSKKNAGHAINPARRATEGMRPEDRCVARRSPRRL